MPAKLGILAHGTHCMTARIVELRTGLSGSSNVVMTDEEVRKHWEEAKRRWPNADRNSLFSVAILLSALIMDVSVQGLYPSGILGGMFVGALFAALVDYVFQSPNRKGGKWLTLLAFGGLPVIGGVALALFWSTLSTQSFISAFMIWIGWLPVAMKRGAKKMGLEST